jgi:hypothetical protein
VKPEIGNKIGCWARKIAVSNPEVKTCYPNGIRE